MNKIVAILVGALIFTVIVQTIQLSQFVKANQSSQNDMEHNHMSCMSMSIEEMDENQDGVCDICGMPISECEEMMGEHEDMEGMMKEHHGMMGMHGMNCHM